MAIEQNRATAWPEAWQEIGAVPYQLIITMPEHTWLAVAQIAGMFVAVAVLVAFTIRKKAGYLGRSFIGIIAAFMVCIPLFMSIDFGHQPFEPFVPLDRPQMPHMSAEATERFLGAMCKAEVFPSDMLETCAARNPKKNCAAVGPYLSACEPANLGDET